MQSKILCAFRLALLLCICTLCVFASVSYDRKSIIINGRRRILFSGSIHYPRSTPEMWPDLIDKAKLGGVDVIQTYVFWNGHEPSPGNYYFEGNYDLVRFIKLVHEAGLYVHLRIGPYVCAEWNFGGLPVWLKYVPGISFRTNNAQFKAKMKRFTKKIVNMMKGEKLYQPQGGPIILSQIENEYGPMEYELGTQGKAYTKWAANMALDLGTRVPWVMCKQDNAPDPIINTCNGFYCDYFSPNEIYKPKMWTEAWTGWYTEFGGAVPYRPVEDLAFSVARFLQNGGAFVNYYMYHGGTNFGRTAGGPFIATSYDYDAPLDEYGLIRQPKWGHLKDLHRAVKLCESSLVSADADVMQLGDSQEAHVFKASGSCCAFLANYDANSFANVAFGGSHHILPPWSISILPDCKSTVYNTARVGAQSSRMKMTPVSMHERLSWEAYSEDLSSEDYNTFSSDGLLEQVNVTRDSSDYLWYRTEVVINSDEAFLNTGEYPVLSVLSAGHALHVFVNGELSGTAYGSLEFPKLSYSEEVRLRSGANTISLLSVAVGLPNVGPHYETWNAGILGPVFLSGLNEGRRDLSWQKWKYKIGLKGEELSLHSLAEDNRVEWIDGSYVSQKKPLMWYKTSFDAPMGNAPLAVDMKGMGKGQVWINGRNLGRYWPVYTAKGTCERCRYEGRYNEKKCAYNCGESSQRWYHVPRAWVNPEGNLLVVLEELGGDPNTIALVRREVDSVCADVHEWQSTLMNYKVISSGRVRKPLRPRVHLECGYGQKIRMIKFASFGTPTGACGDYEEGGCHALHSYDIFNSVCVGQNYCSVTVAPENFGGDPCPAVMKKLAVEAICS